jgi:hypothetical protein
MAAPITITPDQPSSVVTITPDAQSAQPAGSGMLGGIFKESNPADIARHVGHSVWNAAEMTASAPAVAYEIYKRLRGQPNQLDEMPARAALMFAGSEGLEAPAAKSAALQDAMAANSEQWGRGIYNTPVDQWGQPIPPIASASESTPVTRAAVSPANIERTLQQSLDAGKPAPGAPIRSGESIPAVAASEIPAGFKAVESSNLKSIRYSDGLLDVQRRGGEIYRYQLTPDQARDFLAAESKGKAMAKLPESIGKIYEAGTKSERFVPRIPTGPRSASPEETSDIRTLRPEEKSQLMRENVKRRIAASRIEMR